MFLIHCKLKQLIKLSSRVVEFRVGICIEFARFMYRFRCKTENEYVRNINRIMHGQWLRGTLLALLYLNFNCSSYEEKHIQSALSSHKQIRLCKVKNCDIILCGCVHVSKNSEELVKETILSFKPNIVILELCTNRASIIFDEKPNIAPIRTALQDCWTTKGFMPLLNYVLSSLQAKASKLIGNKSGNEQITGAIVGAHNGAAIILGDRDINITIQRLLDKLSIFKLFKLVIELIASSLFLRVEDLQSMIASYETNSHKFLETELDEFSKKHVDAANIIVHERDEYLAQTILDAIKCYSASTDYSRRHLLHSGVVSDTATTNNTMTTNTTHTRLCVVAVIGAAHLKGVGLNIQKGGASNDRMSEITSSSRQLGLRHSRSLVRVNSAMIPKMSALS